MCWVQIKVQGNRLLLPLYLVQQLCGHFQRQGFLLLYRRLQRQKLELCQELGNHLHRLHR